MTQFDHLDEAVLIARECLNGSITPLQASRKLTHRILDAHAENGIFGQMGGARGPLAALWVAADEADRVYFLGVDVNRWHPEVRERKRSELAEAEAKMAPSVHAACRALIEYAAVQKS